MAGYGKTALLSTCVLVCVCVCVCNVALLVRGRDQIQNVCIVIRLVHIIFMSNYVKYSLL